jgi:hypothetical protein
MSEAKYYIPRQTQAVFLFATVSMKIVTSNRD